MSQEETIIVAKNLTSSSVELPQLALTVPGLGIVNLTEFNEVYEIRGDNDLYNFVVSGTIILNDGFVDYDQQGSLNYLNPPTFSSSIGDLFAASSSFQSQIDSFVTGSGLTESTHELLNTLTHDIAESSFDEAVYIGPRLVNLTQYTDATKTTKIREYQFTYTTGRITQAISIQYNNSGVETYRLTEVFTYNGFRVESITRIRTP